MTQQPIALFDSGVGGLSVLKALEHLLPHQSFIYFSDSAHFPYGKKSLPELLRYTSQITAFLISLGAKMIVVPCHTASTLVVPTLRENFPIPMIGMIEPTIKALKKMTLNRRIAIMGTEGTIGSGIYQRAIEKELPGSTLFPLTCPQLEQKIERGQSDVQDLIRHCVKPILGQEIDTLILACTHYPHIRNEIEEELDPQTRALDPSLSIAEEVKMRAKCEELEPVKHLFYTSGDVESFKSFLKMHPVKGAFEMQKVDLGVPRP
ncbi:MAG: glutamate racemase [Verrucomicrobia bacterium]|nr:glutamate racemase [Verrucomicrobiota bacterium]